MRKNLSIFAKLNYTFSSYLYKRTL